MNGQANGLPSPEDQASETSGFIPPMEGGGQMEERSAPLGSSSGPPAPRGKFRISGTYIAGFLGWFLVSWLFYSQVSRDGETLLICGGAMFPVNLIILALLIKFQRLAGLGMLTALAVNMLVSMILQLWTNAFCFLPFYVR